MKTRAFLVAMAISSPAAAVPPAPPLPEWLAVTQAYIQYTKRNDFDEFRKLFSPHATVIIDDENDEPRSSSIATLSDEFRNKTRKTEFLRVIETPFVESGALGDHVLFFERITDCYPQRVECFPYYRIETISLQHGQVTRLGQSAPYLTELSSDGVWSAMGQ